VSIHPTPVTLHRYVDSELPEEEESVIEAHTNDCDRCHHYVESMRQTEVLLRWTARPMPPADFTALVMARLRRVRTTHNLDRSEARWFA